MHVTILSQCRHCFLRLCVCVCVCVCVCMCVCVCVCVCVWKGIQTHPAPLPNEGGALESVFDVDYGGDDSMEVLITDAGVQGVDGGGEVLSGLVDFAQNAGKRVVGN